MKKTIATLLVAALALQGQAQAPDHGKVAAQRKYEIIVNNADIDQIRETNRGLEDRQSEGLNRGLADGLVSALAGAGIGQVVGLTTSVIGLGVGALTKAVKGDREQWHRTAEQQCTYRRRLASEARIDDFYALPSTKGAMDPANLRFEGFGCRNYIVREDDPTMGNDAFYLYCRLRRDSVGLQHITNHSKFMVELDRFSFTPQYCNLPNDSTGRLDMEFSFDGRKDLVLNVKARIYSSWINEAIMVTTDQLLGEFDITARIDPSKLVDGVFTYDPSDPDMDGLVSVSGDCFIVPRSFTGTTDASTYTPAWGTGQYRIEMEITETCKMDDSYYQTLSDNGKRHWNKARWQPEWKRMQAAQRREPNFGTRMWQTVTSGYRDGNWVAVITEPVSTYLVAEETKQLKGIFGLTPSAPSAAQGAAPRP